MYREEVKVTVPSLVIRGSDRNRVVVDGAQKIGPGSVVRPTPVSDTTTTAAGTAPGGTGK